MKAIVLKEHGDLDQVAFAADIPAPEPGPGQVLVALRAAALNRLDLWVLPGWRGLELHFPHVLGADGSGVVAGLGQGVTGIGVGDRVAIDPTLSPEGDEYARRGQNNMSPGFALLGEHVPGCFAEYVVVPAANVIPLPDHVAHTDAAAASLVFVTAWHSLITRGQLRPGEEVLIVGAGGGVNTACIQIARLAGAGRIYVVGSSAAKLAQAETLGADVLINRHEEDWGRAVFRATGRRGVDVVVDNVGAPTFNLSLRALRRGGRLLTVGNTGGARLEIDNRLIFGKHLTIIGSTMGPRQDYIDVMQQVFAGRLQPVIDTVYPLPDGVTALRRLAEGEVAGKLVLAIPE